MACSSSALSRVPHANSSEHSGQPYDANETAAAIEIALHMTREERREHMLLLRRTVKHNNVFRWAARMLVDAAQIRQRQRLAKRALARRPGPRGSGTADVA
jgi:hypothetical protein